MNNSAFRPRALLGLALAAALVSTVAIAQQASTQGQAPARSQKLDLNGDGVIDKAEAAKAPHLAQKFDQLDKNHDGRLTADERPQMQHGGHGGPGEGGGMHDRMMQLDTDKDGRISSKEAAAKPEMAQRFAQLDSNHDGYLDRVDFEAHHRQERAACFAKADTDKDGKLNSSEFDSAKDACHQRGGGMRGQRGGDMPATPPAG